MLDPIVSAKTRLAWAQKHIQDLEAEFRVFAATSPYSLIPKIDSDIGECLVIVEVKAPLPIRLSLTACDAVHNLRATLDGLFRALLQKHGSSSEMNFPLRRSPGGWAEQRVAVANLLPIFVCDVIENFQPYNRGKEVLIWVHDLDIIAKHEALLVNFAVPDRVDLLSDTAFTPMVCIGPVEGESPITRVKFAPNTNFRLKARVTLDIAFGNHGDFYGALVLDVLVIAQKLIREEIIPEFDRLLSA